MKDHCLKVTVLVWGVAGETKLTVWQVQYRVVGFTRDQQQQNCSMKLKRCPVCLLDLHFLNHRERGVEAATKGGSRVGEHSSFQISNQPFSAVFSQHLQPGQFLLWAPRVPKDQGTPQPPPLLWWASRCIPNALGCHVRTTGSPRSHSLGKSYTWSTWQNTWLVWMMPTVKMDKLRPCRVHGVWEVWEDRAVTATFSHRADSQVQPSPIAAQQSSAKSQESRVRLLSWENQSIFKMILFELCSTHCLCTHLQGQSDPMPSSN